jgi:hypothetical protein
MAEREEPIPAKENTASPSPKPHDEEKMSPALAEAAPQTSLAEEKAPAKLPEKENLGEMPPNVHEEPAPAPTATRLMQRPVYFISTVLRDTRERYPMQQKLLYVLIIASRKMRHYFQGHPIKVVTSYPLEKVLCNSNATGRVAEWGIELQPFELECHTTSTIKSTALAEFAAEWTDSFTGEAREEESQQLGEQAPGFWMMHFDGAFPR